MRCIYFFVCVFARNWWCLIFFSCFPTASQLIGINLKRGHFNRNAAFSIDCINLNSFTFLRFSTSAERSRSFSKETRALISPLCSSNKCWKRKNPPLQLRFSAAGPITAYAGLLSQQEPAVAEFHMDDCGLPGPTLKDGILCTFPLILHALYFSAFGGFRCEAAPTEPWTVTFYQDCNRPAVRYNSHTNTFTRFHLFFPVVTSGRECSGRARRVCSLHSLHLRPLTPEHHSIHTQWHWCDLPSIF